MDSLITYLFPQGWGWKWSRNGWAMLSTILALLCFGYIIAHYGRAWANTAQELIKEAAKGLAVVAIIVGGPLSTASNNLGNLLQDPTKINPSAPLTALLAVATTLLLGALWSHSKYQPFGVCEC